MAQTVSQVWSVTAGIVYTRTLKSWQQRIIRQSMTIAALAP